MPRKKTTSPLMYGLMDSSRLTATKLEVTETGTVRLGLVLDLIANALEPYPEARLALSDAITLRLSKSPETRILP